MPKSFYSCHPEIYNVLGTKSSCYCLKDYKPLFNFLLLSRAQKVPAPKCFWSCLKDYILLILSRGLTFPTPIYLKLLIVSRKHPRKFLLLSRGLHISAPAQKTTFFSSPEDVTFLVLSTGLQVSALVKRTADKEIPAPVQRTPSSCSILTDLLFTMISFTPNLQLKT